MGLYDPFIQKYRALRAEDRARRDNWYKQEINNSVSSKNIDKTSGWSALSVPFILGTQGLDNVGRGFNDFFSAWRDSLNGGHGKIEPKDNDFFTKDSEKYANAKDIDDVDTVATFTITNKTEDGSSHDIKVGYKNGKLATVLDYRINPNTGKEEEYEVYGRDNLRSYFKKFYNYDDDYVVENKDHGYTVKTGDDGGFDPSRMFKIKPESRRK